MADQWEAGLLGGLRMFRKNLAYKKGFDDAVAGKPKDLWYLQSRSAFDQGHEEVGAYHDGYANGCRRG